MTELLEVLRGFHRATGCEVAIWAAEEAGGVRLEAAAPPGGAFAGVSPPFGSGPPRRVDTRRGPALLAPIPGPRRAWIAVGPCAASDPPLECHFTFVLQVVSHYLQSALEVEHAANELAE